MRANGSCGERRTAGRRAHNDKIETDDNEFSTVTDDAGRTAGGGFSRYRDDRRTASDEISSREHEAAGGVDGERTESSAGRDACAGGRWSDCAAEAGHSERCC